jgi:hypothetical protein
MIRNGRQAGRGVVDAPPTRSWQALAQRVTGVVLTSDSAGYDAALRPAGQRFGQVRPQALPDAVSPQSEWLRRSWQTVHSWSGGGVYPNYPDPTLTDPERSYWGGNLPRLERVKAVHDPDRILPGLGSRDAS